MTPRVLVLSNNAFSNSDSNGRTLANFLEGWPKECLAQFFLQGTDLNFDVCDNFFRVSDKQALKSVFGIAFDGKIKQETFVNNANSSGIRKKVKKNPLTMLCRTLIWNVKCWKRFGYNKWLENFQPEIVLLQAGDSPFMYRLACDIVQKYDAKLVIYNSEGYYFKDYDYFKSHGITHLFYPLFLKELRRNLEHAYNKAKVVIYSCDTLKKDYDKVFTTPSKVFYTASGMKPYIDEKKQNHFEVSYCGNLGINRHKSLIQIADSLQEISEDIFVNVYGRIPNELVKNELSECKGIVYKGFVPYNEVKEIMYRSDLLLHVESFDEFYIEDLKYAFSTKIADSVSCGKPFLVYAPANLACTQYLIENNAAHVISKKEDLIETLRKLVDDYEFRNCYVKNAILISEKNHNQLLNTQRFQEILNDLQ